jgi:hypothetical protein
MQQREHDQRDNDVHVRVPAIGERVEISRTGVSMRGIIHYADEIQVLVKWDDGSSSSLRVGRDKFEIVEPSAAKGGSTQKGMSTTAFDRMLLEGRDDVRLPIEESS